MRHLLTVTLAILLSACGGMAASGGRVGARDLSAVHFYQLRSGAINLAPLEVNPVMLNDALRDLLRGGFDGKRLTAVDDQRAQATLRYSLQFEARSDTDRQLQIIGDDPYVTITGAPDGKAALVPGLDPPRAGDAVYGELLVDLFDLPAGELLWQGHASFTVAPGADLPALQRALAGALQKMLHYFP